MTPAQVRQADLRTVGIPVGKVGARLHQAHRRHHRGTEKRRRSGHLGWSALPARHKASEDSSYLNELYRSEAEKAGIVYVDIWDGFVDEAGNFSPQGPDYRGQTAAYAPATASILRSSARVSLPTTSSAKSSASLATRSFRSLCRYPVDPGPAGGKPSTVDPAQRPVAGPVVPLTVTRVGSEEVLRGGRAATAPAPTQPSSRTLTKGEPVAAPSGRADDFGWPRGVVNVEPGAVEPTAADTAAPDVGAKSAKPAQRKSAMDAYAQEQKPAQRRPRPRPKPKPLVQQRQNFPFFGFAR